MNFEYLKKNFKNYSVFESCLIVEVNNLQDNEVIKMAIVDSRSGGLYPNMYNWIFKIGEKTETSDDDDSVSKFFEKYFETFSKKEEVVIFDSETSVILKEDKISPYSKTKDGRCFRYIEFC